MQNQTIDNSVKNIGHINLAHNRRQNIVSGFKLQLVTLFLSLSRLKIIFKYAKNPLVGIQTLKKLLDLKQQILGNRRSIKMTFVDGKYRWALYVPGWPSVTWNQFFKSEIHRITPVSGKNNRFFNVFLAITKKCWLQCEHCFEWDSINSKEVLSVEEIKLLVQQFYEKGVSQIQLTGGEPMLRLQDMLEIIRTGPKDVEFWLLTSGLNVTAENASKLKKAGLTGMVVSLDHFDAQLHNAFRSNSNSYKWVQEAVKNAIAQQLVTAVSICTTREFVSEKNLMTYAELAKQMGVSFIQLLEPKAVGHYEGKDVALSDEQVKIIEDFYLKMNYNPQFRNYPIISYHGYYQRRTGCFSASVRSLYVDTNGDLQACPFCRHKNSNAIGEGFDKKLDALAISGCPAYKSFMKYQT